MMQVMAHVLFTHKKIERDDSVDPPFMGRRDEERGEKFEKCFTISESAITLPVVIVPLYVGSPILIFMSTCIGWL
jgi:hypothetical protein